MEPSEAGGDPPGDRPPQNQFDRKSKPELFVHQPFQPGLDIASNIQKCEEKISRCFRDAGVHLHLLSITDDVDVRTFVQTITPKDGPNKGKQVKRVVSRFGFSSEAAKQAFAKVFPRQDLSPGARRSSSLWHVWAQGKPKPSFHAYGIRGAYGRVTEEALASALQGHKARLFKYCRLKAAGIMLNHSDDMFLIVRAIRVPRELTIGEASYKLFRIDPAPPAGAGPSSYAAAAAPTSCTAIQAGIELALAEAQFLASKNASQSPVPPAPPAAPPAGPPAPAAPAPAAADGDATEEPLAATQPQAPEPQNAAAELQPEAGEWQQPHQKKRIRIRSPSPPSGGTTATEVVPADNQLVGGDMATDGSSAAEEEDDKPADQVEMSDPAGDPGTAAAAALPDNLDVEMEVENEAGPSAAQTPPNPVVSPPKKKATKVSSSQPSRSGLRSAAKQLEHEKAAAPTSN